MTCGPFRTYSLPIYIVYTGSLQKERKSPILGISNSSFLIGLQWLLLVSRGLM
ncbi:hypothetical protein GIB67_009636, partial [Kingdonia uniflora]